MANAILFHQMLGLVDEDIKQEVKVQSIIKLTTNYKNSSWGEHVMLCLQEEYQYLHTTPHDVEVSADREKYCEVETGKLSFPRTIEQETSR